VTHFIFGKTIKSCGLDDPMQWGGGTKKEVVQGQDQNGKEMGADTDWVCACEEEGERMVDTISSHPPKGWGYFVRFQGAGVKIWFKYAGETGEN